MKTDRLYNEARRQYLLFERRANTPGLPSYQARVYLQLRDGWGEIIKRLDGRRRTLTG